MRDDILQQTYERTALKVIASVIKSRGIEDAESKFTSWADFRQYMLERSELNIVLQKLSLINNNFMIAFRKFTEHEFYRLVRQHYDSSDILICHNFALVFPWKAVLYCITDDLSILNCSSDQLTTGDAYIDPVLLVDSGRLLVTTFKNYLHVKL